MKIVIFPLLLIWSLWLGAQENPVKVYPEDGPGNAVHILAENSAVFPFTVHLEVKSRNMESDIAFPAKIVVPPNQKNPTVIATLMPKKGKKWGYNFRFTYYRGDILHAKHNDSYIYNLPYEAGKAFRLSQGYNGRFSHRGKLALDFTMKKGTKVCAAREGLVVEVKEDSNRGCKSERCKEDANYILVYHDDGSFANYVHLQKNGSLVEVGQQIGKGELIGLSGDTGWSSGPHLHFEVFLPKEGGHESVATRFQISPERTGIPEEGKKYEALAVEKRVDR